MNGVAVQLEDNIGESAPTASVSRSAWVAFALTFGLMMSDYISRQVLIAAFPFLKSAWSLSDT